MLTMPLDFLACHATLTWLHRERWMWIEESREMCLVQKQAILADHGSTIQLRKIQLVILLPPNKMNGVSSPQCKKC